MVANVLWATGTNGYLSNATTGTILFATSIDGLATGVNVLSTATIDFSAADHAIFCDAFFQAGDTFSPAANGSISLWFLRSPDGGTTFEDGTATGATPARSPDITIPVRNGTTIKPVACSPIQYLPASKTRILMQQNCGATFPSATIGTSNTVRLYTFAIAQ